MNDKLADIDKEISDDEFERIMELDKTIREIIGAERKIILESGHSPTARAKKIKEIIDRRAKDMAKDVT